MSAVIEDPNLQVSRPLAASGERLRRTAAAMSSSAVDAGVRPEEPLGAMLASFADMVVAFSDAGTGTAERIAATLENTCELAKDEVRKLKQANLLANQTIESLKVTEAVIQLRTTEAVQGFMDTVTPDLVKALSVVSVIKERRWNQRQNWTRVSIVAGVLLGVFTFGFFYGGGNFQSKLSGVEAKAAVLRCREAAQPDQLTGVAWCPVKVLDAPSG